MLFIKDVIPKDQLNEESKNKIERIEKLEEKVNRENLILEPNKYIYIYIYKEKKQKRDTLESLNALYEGG